MKPDVSSEKRLRPWHDNTSEARQKRTKTEVFQISINFVIYLTECSNVWRSLASIAHTHGFVL